MSPWYVSCVSARVTTTPVTVRPLGSVSSLVTSAFTRRVTLWLIEQWTYGDGLGIGFGVHEAGIAVAPRAADAGALGPVLLIEKDAARRVERVETAGLKVAEQLLDTGFVGDRRPGVGLRTVAFGRVFAVVTVDLVQPLGLRVPRLEIVVGQRPGR